MNVFKYVVLLCLPLQLYANNRDTLTIKEVIVQGNTKTDLNIILRELSFKSGDVISCWSCVANENRQRLLNLFLFNAVDIQLKQSTVLILLKERLYIWPKLDFTTADRNINQWWLSKDIKRLNINSQIGFYNLQGQNKTLLLKSQLGYTTAFSLGYKQPYINAQKTIGFQTLIQYAANKEIWIQTLNDKLQFYNANDQTMIKRLGIENSLIYRPYIYTYHFLGLGFKHLQISDSALMHQGSQPYLWNGLARQNELNLNYQLLLDRRDYKGYPTQGYWLKAQCDVNRFWANGSALNYMQIKGNAAKYVPISKHIYGAIGVSAKYSSLKHLPYNKFQSLGYGKDYLRGYELYVIDGHAFVISKLEIKWQFMQHTFKFLPKVKHYEFLPTKLFLSLFNDAGYVLNDRNDLLQTNSNQLPNTVLNGYGAGLNIVLFTDYCARLEYSVNKMGGARWYVSFVTAL